MVKSDDDGSLFCLQTNIKLSLRSGPLLSVGNRVATVLVNSTVKEDCVPVEAELIDLRTKSTARKAKILIIQIIINYFCSDFKNI